MAGGGRLRVRTDAHKAGRVMIEVSAPGSAFRPFTALPKKTAATSTAPARSEKARRFAFTSQQKKRRKYAKGVGSLQFLLNGRSVLVDQAPPYTTLLDFIRARGLTGAKEGCAEGEC